ncbi:hypothetical protein EHI8A_098070 [Entamoeba histolytica HM-1:IMSS-B]|uniref:Uncharacterized protein n=5 Tax=Entamoeba histolytica TaxID=5759 RepID=C4M5J5_ENTH1|nr:hypothetical protein EHI_001810 [Entamoeba histolytica HM-1:IMSS]EMD45614.1 Hypothetical protein EHI5A_069370 [Entamoeba histolytica KU27]EMH72116.1 hypothetical protein EHI8A_098070 [Entamoeba histolytica HM-1:IMSS-B]ENY62679.1 hypothetical protein EHI7A_093960 [Entamoeba histolytica HM-1:IMSS-A]GAT96703.1 hypothetical protein CL6EHI_001810 [Entamoeba histolytica]EAL44660.1 hypothetical protein EHI_001810 [Entamoeba histolytica HM-1:IMSS]|eukprot:XP_650047.1 hypothetical protein EHI_001810 [Entamoeba histolytica HM-1:IMSS]
MSMSNSESIINPSQCIGQNFQLSDYPSMMTIYSAVSNLTTLTDDCIDSGSMAAQQIQGTESSSHFAHYSESSLMATDCSSLMDRQSSKLSNNQNILVEENESIPQLETIPENSVVLPETVVEGIKEPATPKQGKKKRRDKQGVVLVKDSKVPKEKHKKRGKK